MKKNKGFTYVELMFAMGLIFIVFGLYMSMVKISAKSKDIAQDSIKTAEVVRNMKNVYMAGDNSMNPGRIFVDTDSNVLDLSATNITNKQNLLKNLLNWYTGGRKGKFLVYTQSPSNLVLPQISTYVMSALSHTSWIVSTNSAIMNINEFSKYDAIFVTQDYWPSGLSEALIQYVNQGGNVYCIADIVAAPLQANFLLNYGFQLSSSINTVNGTQVVGLSNHFAYKDVTSIHYNIGEILTITDEPNARVVYTYGGYNIAAVYEPKSQAITSALQEAYSRGYTTKQAFIFSSNVVGTANTEAIGIYLKSKSGSGLVADYSTTFYNQRKKSNTNGYWVVDTNGYGSKEMIILGKNSYSSYTNISAQLSLNQWTQSTSDFSKTYLFGDINGDGYRDAIQISHQNTTNGWTTTPLITEFSASNAPYFSIQDINAGISGISNTNENNFFEMKDYNNDKKDDLYIFNRIPSTTAGYLTFSVANPNSNAGLSNGVPIISTYLKNRQTGLSVYEYSPFSSQFCMADYNGDGKQDLYCITPIISNGKTIYSIQIMDGRNSFHTKIYNVINSALAINTSSRVKFDVGDHDGDGKADIFCFIENRKSGKVDLSILDGASNYGSYLYMTSLPLKAENFDNYIFNYY